MKSPDNVWIEMGIVPSDVVFCPDEKSWNRLMRLLGTDDPYPTSDGRCTEYTHTKSHLIAITLADNCEVVHSAEVIIGLLAHEATHAWEFAMREMDETNAGSEIKAYAVQYLLMQLMHAFDKTRGMPLMEGAS